MDLRRSIVTIDEHHMTGRLDLMTDIQNIFPVSVKLPNGSNALSSRKGAILLNSKLTLHNVFHVDGFDTNLISLGQLVTENFLVGQLTDRLLILQDRGTRTLTGIGEREGEGLYHFRGVEPLISSKTSVQVDSVLWHNRLGHPSSRAFGMIPGVSGLSSRNSELLISGEFHQRLIHLHFHG